MKFPFNLPLLLDGATGTNLLERGMPSNVCVEEWRQKDGNIAGYRFLAPWKAITFNSYARWPDDQEEGEMDEDEDLEEDEEEDEISQ